MMVAWRPKHGVVHAKTSECFKWSASVGHINKLWGDKCLLRGTGWAFKYIGLDFVLTWLNVRYDGDRHMCMYSIQEQKAAQFVLRMNGGMKFVGVSWQQFAILLCSDKTRFYTPEKYSLCHITAFSNLWEKFVLVKLNLKFLQGEPETDTFVFHTDTKVLYISM
jgi:hypothetical protein